MSAFLPASEYLRAGIDALGPHPFNSTKSSFAIPLHSLYAKACYCIGNIDESRFIAEMVINNITSIAEKESPYMTLISCYFAEDQMKEMIDFLIIL